MKILFAGGGTLGPVTPLLAVAEAWKDIDPSVEFVWIGTSDGPERAPVEEAGIRFVPLPVARLTRYPSFEWPLLPVNAARAAYGAWKCLERERPDLVASAGGFTGVPVIAAARLLDVPSWLHQSDVRPILSGRLSAPFATLVTTAWESTAEAFPRAKTRVVGNPVRRSMLAADRDAAVSRFGLDSSRPTLLVTGGGGGAAWINRTMETVGGELARLANVIHIVGPGKRSEALLGFGSNYVVEELLTGAMADALAAADMVVSRAGMGTITELAARRKPSVIVPLPNSPQEDNARALEDAGAAVVLRQGSVTPQEFLEAVLALLRDESRRRALSASIASLFPTDVAGRLVALLRPLAKK
jgi:UDP-N-acetylglucosamine--N-acetylmuramyl-(pentapeptide) pyrophosphoryl-undecaprenol N-acetylglucosamine transferase